MKFVKRILILFLLLVTGLGLGASDRAAKVSYGDRWGAKAGLTWTSKCGVQGALGGDDFVAAFNKNTKMENVWVEARVLEEIVYVKSNPANKVDDRTWIGTASDRTLIEVRYTGADINNLTFSTVFPK